MLGQQDYRGYRGFPHRGNGLAAVTAPFDNPIPCKSEDRRDGREQGAGLRCQRLHRDQPGAATPRVRLAGAGGGPASRRAGGARLARRRTGHGGCAGSRDAARGFAGHRRCLLPRALDGGRERFRGTRCRGREELCGGGGRGGRRPHRIPWRTYPGGPALTAPEVTGRDRRRAEARGRTGNRDSCRHDRRSRVGGLRGHSGPRQLPAGHGHAALGTIALDAYRARKPAGLPRPGRTPAGG